MKHLQTALAHAPTLAETAPRKTGTRMDAFCPFKQRLNDKSKTHGGSHAEQLSPVVFIRKKNSEGGPP